MIRAKNASPVKPVKEKEEPEDEYLLVDGYNIIFAWEELRELARTGTGVAHCPISNMKLSSGIARIPEMLELGVPVGLAVDGSASITSPGRTVSRLMMRFLSTMPTEKPARS